MNNISKPTVEELSLYYDGLLDEKRRLEIQSWLENDPSSQHILDAFTLFNRSQQPDLQEAELDGFLNDTVQNIHAHIYMVDRDAKYKSTSVLSWLSPKVWVSTLAFSLTAFTLFVTINFNTTTDPPQIPLAPETPNISVNSTPASTPGLIPSENPVQDEWQHQAVLATARFAKNWLDQGWQYASTNSERVTQPLIDLKTGAERALTQSQLPPLMPRTEPGSADNPSEPPSAIQTLANVGRQQVAIGLGVSLLTFASSL